jgi:hypothetical protein
MEVAVIVVLILMSGLGAIIGACLTTMNLRKAFIFTIHNATDYVVDVRIDYFTKEVVVVDVAKQPAKPRAKRTK